MANSGSDSRHFSRPHVAKLGADHHPAAVAHSPPRTLLHPNDRYQQMRKPNRRIISIKTHGSIGCSPQAARYHQELLSSTSPPHATSASPQKPSQTTPAAKNANPHASGSSGEVRVPGCPGLGCTGERVYEQYVTMSDDDEEDDDFA